MDNTFLVILFMFLVSSFNLASFAGVYDGGLFSKDGIPLSIENEGGKSGVHLPQIVSVADDRRTFATVISPIYVLDENQKCFWGHFTEGESARKLVVYTKSEVTVDHCIYQKKFNKNPQGFSILTSDGGVCRPSFADSLESLNENLRGSIHTVDKTVSMSNCVEHTVSYGAVLEKRANDANQVAASVSLPRMPASVISTKYSVQLSSHPTEEEAKKEILNYENQGMKAFYTTGLVNGKKWYRVCSGHFPTKKAADVYRHGIAGKKGFDTSFIIKLE